ncbi:MAG: precorrin-3B C(17)-methyltransferase [Phyllobacterium sp.]
MTSPLAILILGQNSLATGQRIKACFEDSTILGLEERVTGADAGFCRFGETIRDLYQSGTPIVALCSAGIIIRALAPLLQDKMAEPPVLAVAEDGSAVVPLLGGTNGVNAIARKISEALAVPASITTTGELRFGTSLLHPPKAYQLRNPQNAKRFISDMLAGSTVRISGKAPWLAQTRLPIDDNGTHSLRITPYDGEAAKDELVFHPRTIVAAVLSPSGNVAEAVEKGLAAAGLARSSLACLVAREADIASVALLTAEQELGIPLYFSSHGQTAADLAAHFTGNPDTIIEQGSLAFAIAATPDNIAHEGHRRGRLTVIGLGPGDSAYLTPAAKRALEQADDVLGYETYVRMAGPLRADQTVHMTDNREEMQRARHAFELAANGRTVVMVSSGDPGVFAMATAVLEALHLSDSPTWHAVELSILPGISAANAAASLAGAPLGHDFCIISLSDNLKPWSIIESRLDHAAQADLVMALYNPISRARPHQLGEALAIVRKHRQPETLVVLGRDVGRPAQALTVTKLGDLTPDQVDMRTVVIVGSSTTRGFPRLDGGQWIYTPRWYGDGNPGARAGK